MRLSDEDLKDLKASLYRERPSFYKDVFHFNAQSLGVVAFLRRNGIRVECNDDNGSIIVERKTG